MDKKIQIIAIVGVMIFSVFVLTSPTDPIPLPDPTINSENDSVKILAENLKKPRAIAVADDRIFVTEQDGQIRIITCPELTPKDIESIVNMATSKNPDQRYGSAYEMLVALGNVGSGISSRVSTQADSQQQY